MSILKAGDALRAQILASEQVREITENVFPVISDTAELPYVAYRRAALDPTATKGDGRVSAAIYEVECYAQTYAESLELAEAVTEATDGKAWRTDELTVRGCALTDAIEEYAGDAYCQVLVLRIRC